MTAPSPSEQQADDSALVATDGPPLLIVLEHGLLQCDVTMEALVAALKSSPGRLFDVLNRVIRGRTALRPALTELAPLDVGALPANAELIALAQAETATGRPVYLVLADLPLSPADALKRFPFATGAIVHGGQDDPGRTSLATALAQRFPGGFDLAAGPATDPAIWQGASHAILVGGAEPDHRRISAFAPIRAHIRRSSPLRSVLQGLRLHQWMKNLLVFAPFILGGAVSNPHSWLETAVCFLAMGLVSSATYLINDILDIADDRRHWSKRRRPIASGDLSISTAAILAVIGLVAGLGLAAVAAWQAVQVLLVYVGLTLTYSLAIKRLPLVDGFTLAVLFTLRLALGVVATDVPPSPWLFVFSMFLFTSLSLAKRYTELGRAHPVRTENLAGRGYRGEDAPLVLAVGVATGLSAVLIMILYILEDAFRQSFYTSVPWLWGFPPVVFLMICRIWLVTVRGEMNDDPVKFMIGDGPCRVLLAALMICFVFAWLA
jgi:4-hydroxybenzoate polyprenyltransferase